MSKEPGAVHLLLRKEGPMLTNSQLKRIPGLQKVVHFARTTLHPDGYEHWARVVMDQETDRLIRGLDLEHSSALEISGQKWRGRGFRHYLSVEFPAYDVCSAVLDDQFDIIIAEQVFEHLLWPYRAVRNVFQMLTPNGAFLITTPFLIRFTNTRQIARAGRSSEFDICLQRADLISIVSPPDHGVIGHASARICKNGRYIIAGCIRLRMNRITRSLCGHSRVDDACRTTCNDRLI